MTTHGVVIAEEPVGAEAPAQTATYSGPAYIPEKFRSAEDPAAALAAAYAELEKKLGAGTPPAETPPPPNPEAPAETPPQPNPEAPQTGLAKFAAEFEKEGKLSDESYKELEKLGIDRVFVDNYIAGVQAVVSQRQTELQQAVGGAEAYEQMMAWGAANLTKAEQDAYDAALSTGDMDKIKAAAAAIHKKFTDANGQNPQVVVEGGTAKSTSGGYASRAELTRDQQDPRYATDPVFRDQVMKRALASNF